MYRLLATLVASCFAFLCLLPCTAQQAPQPVEDLLRVDALGHGVRFVASIPRPASLIVHEQEGWHRVVGEGQFRGFVMGAGGEIWFADEPTPQGLFEAGNLIRTLAALGDLPESDLDLEYRGRVRALRSQIPERLAVALAALRAGLPPRIHARVVLEAITDGTATILLAGEHTFMNGETATIADVDTRSYVPDFGVEIAQAAATANPAYLLLRSGASVLLRARTLPRGDACIVETVVRVVDLSPADPIEPYPALGPLDRIADTAGECGVTFRVAPGMTTRHEWLTRDGRTLRLTCIADWQPPGTSPSQMQIVCSPLFGSPVLDFRSLTHGEPDDAEPGSRIADLVQAEIAADPEGLVRFDEGGKPGSGCLLVEGDEGRALVGRVDAAIDAALQPVDLRIEVLDVPADTAISASGDLPPDARRLAHVTGPTLLEHAACFAAARELSYIRGWSTEVAQSARIPDPQIGLVEDGCFVTVRPLSGPGGGAALAEVRVDVERMTGFEVKEIKLNRAMTALASVTDDTRSPAMWLPQDIVRVEQPIEHSVSLHRTLALDQNGRAVLRNSAPALLGAGRDLVIRIEVR